MVGWRPCSWCLGAHRYLEPALNGEGLIPVICANCRGDGREPVLMA